MKPCKSNRRLIAWSVLGELDQSRNVNLLAHLDQCEGCRQYFDEMSQLTRTLGDKGPSPRFQANELFHQELVRKLKSSGRDFTLLDFVQAWSHSLANWKIALPFLGAGALIVIALLTLKPAPSVPIATQTKPDSQPAQRTTMDIDPTISNYSMLALQSFDRFDDLLTQQGTRNLPPTPVYTASARVLPSAAE